MPAIGAEFPGTVQGGVLDRAALRALVLGDRAGLRVLEAILHPLVRAEQRRFLARARARGCRMAALDIPLLFETGGDALVDRVMVVSAPRAIQLARLRRRRGMSEGEAARMIALQMPDAEKRRRADVVVRTGLSRFHAARGVFEVASAREGKRSFLKKGRKNFSDVAGVGHEVRDSDDKRLLLLFFRKEGLPSQ